MKRELKQGHKDDNGKTPFDLVSPLALEALGDVLNFGARKYAPRNWEKGLLYGRVFAATLRHLYAFWKGEDFDKETGLHHLAHALCCTQFLLHYELKREKYKKFDDRPK